MSNPALTAPPDSVFLRAQAEQIAAAYIPPTNGRASRIGDADCVQLLLAAIQEGSYLETACKLAGLSKVTVYDWIKRGETGEEPHATFLNALQKAEAQAEHEMVRAVRKAGQKEAFWAAAATHLERRHPDRWGKRQTDNSTPAIVVNVHQVGDGEVKVGVQVTGLSPASSLPESESLQIPSGIASESDKQGYVNQAKSLITEVIALPQRSQSEAGDARATGDTLPLVSDAGAEIQGGTLPRGVAGRARSERPKKRASRSASTAQKKG